MSLLPSLVLAWALTPAPCTAAIEGQVVDLTSGESVAKARVRMPEGSADDAGAQTVTDETGRYRLDGICPGSHALEVTRADYETVRETARVGPAGVVTVDVTVQPRLVERVDDVVVVAPAPVRTETRASTTLEGEDLAETRGEGLADAISRVPGVTFSRGSAPTTAKPIIRGQIGRRNLLLYDRVRHESQKWGLEHAPEIDPFSAGSITVIKGAGTVRYGSDAVGGIVLVDPPPMRTEPGISGATHLVAMSNPLGGAGALRVEGAHAKAPGFVWRVEGNATRTAAAVAPDYPLDNSASLLWNAGTKVGYVSDAFDLTATYRRYFLRAGICTCLTSGTPEDFKRILRENRPINWELYEAGFEIDRPLQRVTHDLAMARGRANLGAAGELTATYSFQFNQRQEFEIIPEYLSGPQYEFDLRTHAVDLVFEHTPVILTDALTLMGSAGGAFARQVNGYEAATPLIPDYEQWSGGVFLIERLVANQVELEVGGRYDALDRRATLDRFHYPVMLLSGRLQEDSCRELEDESGQCDATFHTGSASVGLLGRPIEETPEFLIKLDLTSAARMPSPDEQFQNGGTPSFPVLGLGDMNLGVERTWGTSLTVAHATPWIAAEGAAYVNFIQDYIYFQGVPSQGQCAPLSCQPGGAFQLFEFRNTNALFYGGELGFTVAPPKWPVEFEADGSWVRADDLENDAYLPFIPPDRYRAGVTYRWPKSPTGRSGRFGISGTFVDEQRRTDPIDLDAPPDPDAAPGSDFAPPPPAFFLLGASAGVSFDVDGQVLRLTADGANLLNTRYRHYTSLLRYYADEPGWSVRLRFSVEFEILPAASAPRR